MLNSFPVIHHKLTRFQAKFGVNEHVFEVLIVGELSCVNDAMPRQTFRPPSSNPFLFVLCFTLILPSRGFSDAISALFFEDCGCRDYHAVAQPIFSAGPHASVFMNTFVIELVSPQFRILWRKAK